MIQQELLDQLQEVTISCKEKACEKEPTDLCPQIVVVRGNHIVGVILLMTQTRDSMLNAVDLIAGGFDADALGLAWEGYAAGIDPATGAPYERNPRTGATWGWYDARREMSPMQDLALNHGGLTKGWVKEVITLNAVNRAGDISAVGLPYRYAENGSLVWERPRTYHYEIRGPVGVIPNRLRKAMLRPSLSQMVHTTLSRIEKDTITVEELGDIGCMAILADRGE